jgi:hypothetical protein
VAPLTEAALYKLYGHLPPIVTINYNNSEEELQQWGNNHTTSQPTTQSMNTQPIKQVINQSVNPFGAPVREKSLHRQQCTIAHRQTHNQARQRSTRTPQSGAPSKRENSHGPQNKRHGPARNPKPWNTKVGEPRWLPLPSQSTVSRTVHALHTATQNSLRSQMNPVIDVFSHLEQLMPYLRTTSPLLCHLRPHSKHLALT